MHHYRADRLQLESVERKIAGIVAAVEAGSYSRALNDRLAELERQHEVIQARLTQRSPSTVRLHPRLAEVYADKIRDLERSLNDPEIKEEAVDVLRSLIDRIEMHPGSEGKSVDAVLYGDMAEIFALCAARTKETSGEQRSRGVNSRWLRGLATSVVCTWTMRSFRRVPDRPSRLKAANVRT